jgi:hypothetical protein
MRSVSADIDNQRGAFLSPRKRSALALNFMPDAPAPA